MVAVLKTAFAFLANVGSNPTPSASREIAHPRYERQFMPDKSGNYKSSFVIVIITFRVSTRGLARESKLANESLSSG
jgi:hypothetical protein